MTRASVALVLALGPLTLAAQNGSPAGTPNSGVAGPRSGQITTLVRLPNPGACPIGMQANQGVWDHSIRVRDGDKETAVQPFGQKISLTLKDSQPARIQAATVRVDGLTGKNRMLQASAAQNGDARRTLRVKFAAQDDSRVSADLWLDGFTAVTSIQLLEVSYADGSNWEISGSNVCRVQPDPLMLVSNR